MGRQAIPWQERLIPEPNSGCWLWDGAVNNDGYGTIFRGGKQHKVHRLAWEEAHGPIPDGLNVCHTCDVPACCNPAHLFLGSQQDNMQDCLGKGRFKGGSFLNALKTHCPQGHEYTPENTLTYRGMRTCRQCNKERCMARYYARKGRKQ